MPDWARLPAQAWRRALTAYAAMWPSSRIFGKALIAPARPGELALTFDDGPNATWTPRLLEILARHEVRATFFLLGSRAEGEPELVRRIAAAGHLIGNHSWSHPNLARSSSSRVREELERTNETLEQITGAPVKFFRPPFGARRPAVLRIARELGLTPVLWNAMTSDWSEPSAERIADAADEGDRGAAAARPRGEHRAPRRRSPGPGRESRALSDRGGDADRAVQGDAPVCDGGCVELSMRLAD